MKTILFAICAGILLSTTGCVVLHRHHEDVIVPVVPAPVIVEHGR
jgi:hypothetical protein